MLSIFLFYIDAIRVVSQMWKDCDIDTKQKMTDIYKEKFEKYKKEIQFYKDGLTENQKNEIFKNQHMLMELKARRKLKRV